MTATLIVQTDAGTVTGANAYTTVVAFKAYCDNRGYDYSAYTDDQIAQAIIRATDYVDTRFGYQGTPLNGLDQTTQFPRDNLYNCAGLQVTGLPVAVVRACTEYAFAALDTALYENAPMPDDGRPLIQESITAGPVTTNQTWVSPQIMTIQLGQFPAADRLLSSACFVKNSSQGTYDR